MEAKCLVALAVVALTTGACATSRMGEAEVRLSEGQVCFAPAPVELQRPGATDIVGIWVSDLSRKPVVEVWVMARDPDAKPIALSTGDCIAYGATAEKWTRTQPVALAHDTVYAVSLTADLKDPTDSTRAFQAKFCLRAETPGGVLKLIQLRPGTAGWRKEVCQEP
jgi:hypothetical protein